ncbi:MAG: Asp-tRNA(Asn)/Glu-tRNA(Gln) amidotransferase subunit GatA [Planctomycetaceae bacterium]|nr:Asp-tRNA(Asn)/Glu-tRNA(Gln) amidotransferase subunit GatA [Planctomycetaceae bacterium]
MSLIELTAAQLRDGLAAGRFSAQEITQSLLERIERVDRSVGAFLRMSPDAALAQAAASDQRRAAGRCLSPLDGIPVALKDVLCTAGEPTTCSSRMLANFVPPYDATVVRKLREAGLVLLGKTNLDEFAMGNSTENAALGTTRNPWDARRVPGGSSGGSAAAVAARMVPWAIGTDTGGSIRQPAAFCGTVGLKPTYGRVSRFGVVAFASSLDQVGPLARTAADAALLLEVIAGPDPQDATSAPVAVEPYSRTVAEPLESLTLGVVREQFGAGLDAEVGAAVERAIGTFQALGGTIREVTLPHSGYGVATYYLIASCEASSNLARYDGAHFGYRTDEAAMGRAVADQQRQQGADAADDDGDSGLLRMYRQTRAEAFGPEVKRRIMLGTYALSAGYYEAYYLKALQVRRLIRQDFDAVFGQVDLLIGPTTPTAAYCAGEKLDDPLAMYQGDLYTATANLAGIAGLSLPCGFTRSGLPIGVQLLAPAFHESRLLRAAHHYQQRTDWHTRTPELS